jgi:hypothetical protein
LQKARRGAGLGVMLVEQGGVVFGFLGCFGSIPGSPRWPPYCLTTRRNRPNWYSAFHDTGHKALMPSVMFGN